MGAVDHTDRVIQAMRVLTGDDRISRESGHLLYAWYEMGYDSLDLAALATDLDLDPATAQKLQTEELAWPQRLIDYLDQCEQTSP